jgi:hypothetical protein
MQRLIIATVFLFCISQQLLAQAKPISALVTKDVQLKATTGNIVDVTTSPTEKKSVMLAIAASLVLPGMGELYAGSFESGKYHLIAEGGLWMTYAGFRIHSSRLKQDAETFAYQHAGVNFNNKDDQYSVNIGNFNTTDEYNQAKLRNREYDLVYSTDAYKWQWDTDASRLRFKDLRIRSGEVKNNAKFIIAVVVVNHLISAFSAGRKAAAYNRALSALDDIQIQTFSINNGSYVDGFGISITKIF